MTTDESCTPVFRSRPQREAAATRRNFLCRLSKPGEEESLDLVVNPSKPGEGPVFFPLDGRDPVTVEGKFFRLADEKFFLKGVTYGPFAPGSHGDPFPEKWMLEEDLETMVELGANCLRTFTVPPRWLLDSAAAYGMRVMVGIPWAQHIGFLDSSSIRREIRQTIRRAVGACKGSPAAFAFLVGNEIPPDMVRWYGPRRVRSFLLELMDEVKNIAPDSLVSYANFPSTEYLEIDFTDFAAFNVYLHSPAEFRRYLSHLQNLAGDRPLVLTEFGMDSMREGMESQAATLSWQVQTSFQMGAAGTVIFAWSDDWYTISADGGFQVDDWAFGLIDRGRRRKPAFDTVKNGYQGPLPPPLPAYPKVSVVVCAYNAERTMDQCLNSLERLHYPEYEVIVVNDGSNDRTLEIAQRHGWVRIINQENQGLSAARNVGTAAATGEIVAFTDSDCMADPDWLTYLIGTFLSTGQSAVGGPNLPPADDCRVASCVAVSPGAPTHVLLDDEVAEHIPGCNMAFRREVLEEIGGFDPVFRTAGDDVDLCWRLQNKGYTIGLSPAALVWHFRRNTVKDYFKQQMGYGKAEALLYFKHPYRFNVLGQSRWFGRIYGDLYSFFLSRRPMIYSGPFGRGLFQTLYQTPCSLISFLPLTLEWNLAGLALLGAALWRGGGWWLGVLPLLVSLAWCAASATKAKIDPRFRGFRSRLLVTLLVFLGPLLRGLERYRWRLRRLREVKPVKLNGPRQRPEIQWLKKAFFLSYWTDQGLEKESLLYGIMNFLLPRKYFIALDQGWSDWDMEVYHGVWAKAQIKTVAENHSGQKRVLRICCALKLSRLSAFTLGAYVLATGGGVVAGLPLAGAAGLLGLVHGGMILYQKFRLGRTLYHVTEIVAKRIELLPLPRARTVVPR